MKVSREKISQTSVDIGQYGKGVDKDKGLAAKLLFKLIEDNIEELNKI